MTYQEFKDTHFGGDDAKALQRLAHEAYLQTDFELTGSKEQCILIIKELDGDLADRYMKCLGAEMDEHPEVIKEIVDEEVVLAYLRMEEAEILAAEKNPFVRRIRIGLYVTLGVFAGGCLLGLILQLCGVKLNWGMTAGIGTLLVAGGFGAHLADNIVKACYFKRYKKKFEAKRRQKTS
ncbi:MAG: hypothetical protein IJC46_04730 [Clostridia bacterium]|nr:hypothetical protein [Clostridia bacterium]